MLPKKFEWLETQPMPKMIVEAVKLYGIKETQGVKNTPAIMSWATELEMDSVYTADSVPWCGLFMGIVAHRAGKKLPPSPLWARSWASWGDGVDVAELGDVLVFVRNGGGHVGLYIGEDILGYYHVLGGNQGDSVSITRIPKSRCIAKRRSYKVKPDFIRRIWLNPTGAVSKKEF